MIHRILETAVGHALRDGGKVVVIYRGIDANYWFWRTYDRQEIDLIEEHDSHLGAFEFKWGRSRKGLPKLFMATYPQAESAVITPDAAHDFL